MYIFIFTVLIINKVKECKKLEGFKFGNDRKKKVGVSKYNQNQNRVSLFFQIYLRKFWKLMGLNALYLILCIPVVTIGPATAAMMKILRNYSQERGAFLISDFFNAFKSNFKQSFIMGIIDLVLVGVITYSCYFYYKLSSTQLSLSAFLVLMITVAFIFISMHFYIYLMIVSINLSLKDIIKNSLILSIIEMKTNLITLVIFLAVVAFNVLLFPFSVLLIPLFPFSLIGLVVAFNCYPKIRKHIIQPYYDKIGELNPEFEYLVGPDGESESVFNDTV